MQIFPRLTCAYGHTLDKPLLFYSSSIQNLHEVEAYKRPFRNFYEFQMTRFELSFQILYLYKSKLAETSLNII